MGTAASKRASTAERFHCLNWWTRRSLRCQRGLYSEWVCSVVGGDGECPPVIIERA